MKKYISRGATLLLTLTLFCTPLLSLAIASQFVAPNNGQVGTNPENSPIPKTTLAADTSDYKIGIGGARLELTTGTSKDRNKVEQLLTGTFDVVITAKKNDIYLDRYFYLPWKNIKDKNQTVEYGTNSTNEKTTIVRGATIFTYQPSGIEFIKIRAGETAVFKVTQSTDPKMLPPGAYTLSIVNIYFRTKDLESTLSPKLSPISTNKVTIVGETGPFISAVVPNTSLNVPPPRIAPGELVTLKGERLNGTKLEIDQVNNSIQKISKDGTELSFVLASSTPLGYRSMRLNNKDTGYSNFVTIEVVPASVKAVSEAKIVSSSLSLLASSIASSTQNTTVELSLTASFQVAVTAGNSDVVIAGIIPINLLGPGSNGMIGPSVNNVNGAQSTISVVSGASVVASSTQYVTQYRVPAGTTAVFNMTRTVDPKKLYGGSYVAELQNIFVAGGDPTTANSVLLLGTIHTNPVIIIGEKIVTPILARPLSFLLNLPKMIGQNLQQSASAIVGILGSLTSVFNTR